MKIKSLKKTIILLILLYISVFLSKIESAVDLNSSNQIQSDDITAVFIYNTALDSDNGSWCNDNTKSWYNEAGPFPKVSYLLLSNSGLDIIDANTKATWMQFYEGFNHILPDADYTSVAALNGKILIGSKRGLIVLDFISDSAKWFTSEDMFFIKGSVSARDEPVIWCKVKGQIISNDSVNDVAITRIGEKDFAAVGTDKCISVIDLEDNIVCRCSGKPGVIKAVAWGGDDLYYGGENGLYVKYDLGQEESAWTSSDSKYSTSSYHKLIDNNINDVAVRTGTSTASIDHNTIYVAAEKGVTEIQEHRFLPDLDIVTHWSHNTIDLAYNILPTDNITHIATDGASLWAGGSLGVSEIKLVNKGGIYKNYSIESSPQIIDNNITSLSANGLVLVGTPTGCTVLDSLWWDNPGYKYRQQLIVTNNSTSDLKEGYTAKFTLNHEDLVNNTKSLVNGNDIRIVFYDGSKWTELDRALDINSNRNNAKTTICFKTQAIIPHGYSDNCYYMYYGNPKASDPPSNKNNVYLLWEDFEDDKTGLPPSGWTSDSEGEFVVAKSISNRLRKYRYINSENDITIDSTEDMDNFELTLLTRKLTSNVNQRNKLGILFHSGNNGYRLSILANGISVLEDEEFKPVPATVTDTTFLANTDYALKLQVLPDKLKAYWNNANILESDIVSGTGKIGFFNDNNRTASGPEIDELLLRKLIEPEPSVISNNVEMTNTPTGNIIMSEQTKDGYVEMTITIDSPYDQILKAKLEWSLYPTNGFQKCHIRTGSNNISSDYPDGIGKPSTNNTNPYQIENIPTSKGPNALTIEWAPVLSSGFPVNTAGIYWIRLTVSNDSCEQEVPDIISLRIDATGIGASIPEETTPDIDTDESEAGETGSALSSEIAASISAGLQIIQENLPKEIEEIQDTTAESIERYFTSRPVKLAFITPPQTIKVNTISKVITVQVQDAFGNPVVLDQDIVIELSSTSG